MCFLAPVAEEIIFRFLLNSSIGWGRYSRVSRYYYYLTAFAFYAYTISLCGDFCLSVVSSILCVVRMRSRGLMIPIILHILNNAQVIFGLLFFSDGISA
ncbi:CPBP family intramembrane metalloprotease [Salmonella enterica subsp. enterica]|nr:CPBP family intramembrane metalloprotease [Salmonella enterica subsp. enterica]